MYHSLPLHGDKIAEFECAAKSLAPSINKPCYFALLPHEGIKFDPHVPSLTLKYSYKLYF